MQDKKSNGRRRNPGKTWLGRGRDIGTAHKAVVEKNEEQN